jgi:hypothetical protein
LKVIKKRKKKRINAEGAERTEFAGKRKDKKGKSKVESSKSKVERD